MSAWLSIRERSYHRQAGVACGSRQVVAAWPRDGARGAPRVAPPDCCVISLAATPEPVQRLLIFLLEWIGGLCSCDRRRSEAIAKG